MFRWCFLCFIISSPSKRIYIHMHFAHSAVAAFTSVRRIPRGNFLKHFGDHLRPVDSAACKPVPYSPPHLKGVRRQTGCGATPATSCARTQCKRPSSPHGKHHSMFSPSLLEPLPDETPTDEDEEDPIVGSGPSTEVSSLMTPAILLSVSMALARDTPQSPVKTCFSIRVILDACKRASSSVAPGFLHNSANTAKQVRRVVAAVSNLAALYRTAIGSDCRLC